MLSAEQYQLSYAFTSSQQGNPFVTFKLTGVVELANATSVSSELPELRRAKGDERIVHGVFRGVLEMEQAGKASPPGVVSTLQKGFGEPFFAKFKSNGQLERLFFAHGVERLVQTSWRGFMSALQHVPFSPTADTWEVEEADSNGSYLARYVLQSSSQGRHVTKEKLKYLTASANVTYRIDGFRQSADFELPGASAAKAAALDVGFLRGLEFSEKTNAVAGGMVALDVTGETSISLTHVKTLTEVSAARLPVDLAEQLGTFEIVELSDAGSSSARERELDTAIVQGATFESTLMALRKSPKNDDDRKRRNDAYRQFASLLRLHPEKAAELAKWIKEGDELSNTFLSALRDASTKESQAALVDVHKSAEVQDAVKVNAVRALSLVTKPTTEATGYLRELSTSGGLTGEQAIYGLGSHAARAAANGQNATPIVDELLDRLNKAESSGEEAQYLTALGNAGNRESVDEVTAKTKSRSEVTRREAVHALRHVVGSDVDATLVEALLSGDPDVVRVQAAKAIRDREHTDSLRRAIAQSIRAEQSRLVKTAVLQVASLWVKDSAEIRSSLQWFLEHETDPMLLKAATAALSAV